MRIRRTLGVMLGALAILGAFAPPAQAHAPDPRVPAGFTEQRTRVGAININYVRGGHGPTLVLLHGFPETWYMWRKVLPALAEHYTVIAPDSRGSGLSDAPATGYDKHTLATDLHGLLTELGLSHHIRLVGHDIGTMIAYAYAATYPADVEDLVLSEAPIPDADIYKAPSLTADGPGAWHFGFFSLANGLPEAMVSGHEAEWVDGFTDWLEVQKDGVGPTEIREFSRYLRDPAHLRASFAYFRAFPQDIDANAVNIQSKLTMPVLAIGASGSLGASEAIKVREYATNVTEAVIPNSGHWIYEEQPAYTTKLLLDFLDNGSLS